MTALALAAQRQAPRISGLAEVVLLSVTGFALSLALVHFGIDLGTLG